MNAVTGDPQDAAARTAAFWFAPTGIGLVATGLVVTSVEHHVTPLPRSVPWVLAVVAEARRRRSSGALDSQAAAVQ